MQTPTTSQLRTAIEVLNKLGERLNEHAAHSVIQIARHSHWATAMPRASSHEPLNKSAALKPSPCN